MNGGGADGTVDDGDVARVREVVTAGLGAVDLDAEQVAPDTWMTVLEGRWKRTLPVLLRVDDRSLHVEALLSPSPDEGHEDVFRFLLRRNQRALPIHFALSDEGDVVMVGDVPLRAVDETTFDRLLGAVLTTADEVFNTVLRKGFSSYIDAEQRWRAANDLPPNPVSDEG